VGSAPRPHREHVRLESLSLEHAEGLHTAGRDPSVWTWLSRLAAHPVEHRGEGVLRAHCIRKDVTLRDTVVHSVTAPEWPAVRDRLRLTARLRTISAKT
jgi:hypothetical protein